MKESGEELPDYTLDACLPSYYSLSSLKADIRAY